MARQLSAFQKAYIRHAVAQEVERRDGDGKASVTDQAFAEVMGVHAQTVKAVKVHPVVKEALAKAIEELDLNHDYYQLCLKRWALEQLVANYRSATGAERRHYLTKLLEITKDVEELDTAPDYADMTDDDLNALCLKREVSPLGMTHDEIRAVVKKKGA